MKYYKTVMSNGDEYFVPALFIVEARAKYYSQKDGEEDNLSPEEEKKVFDEEVAFALEDDYEIEDWARNNMDWDEVATIAILRPRVPLTAEELQEGWVNGNHEVVETALKEKL